jgi:putative CocE/NonD family hydrolase
VGVTGCSNLGGSTIVLSAADQLRMEAGKPRAVAAAWADSFFPDVYRASVGQGGASITPATLAIVGLIDSSWAYGGGTQSTASGTVPPEPVYQPVVGKQAEVNAGTSSYDDYWRAIDTTSLAPRIDIPIGMTAAISDLWQLGLMPFDYALRVTHSPHPSFFLSPGGHCLQGGWDKLTYGGHRPGSKAALVMAWFDHWLKGANNGIDRLPNWNIYPTGATGWTVQSKTMPTRGTTLVDYYLDDYVDNAPAGSVPGVGRLTSDPPPAAGRDAMMCAPCGPNVEADPLDSVASPVSTALRYDSPAFPHDVTLAGNTLARIWADFDRSDGTLAANLFDVAPDGRVTHITDAQIRARDRAVDPQMSFYARGHLLDAYHPLTVATRQDATGVREYDLTFAPSAYVLPAGHRLELRVGFTDPKYVLPGPLLASMTGETVHVLHGGVYASRVTVSVITGPTAGPADSYDRRPTTTSASLPRRGTVAAGTRPAVQAPSTALAATGGLPLAAFSCVLVVTGALLAHRRQVVARVARR